MTLKLCCSNLQKSLQNNFKHNCSITNQKLINYLQISLTIEILEKIFRAFYLFVWQYYSSHVPLCLTKIVILEV